MLRFILQRLLALVPLLLLVSLLVFSLVLLIPGDPAYQLAGEDATPEQLGLLMAGVAGDETDA